jgi:lysophospholipase L1-like esterase
MVIRYELSHNKRQLQIMKITTYILVLIGLAILFQIGWFVWHVRIGRHLAAIAKPYERILPEAKYKILIVGDSTVLGTGSKDPRESVVGLWGKNFPKASITNRGKNGRRTAEIPAVLEEFADASFDLMIIHSGGNDIIYRTPLDKLEQDLDAALRAAKQKAKVVAILHSGNVGTAPIFPWPLSWFYTHRTRQVRDIYVRKAQEQSVIYVDLFAERANDPFLTDVNNFYATDFLHLGPRGNQFWFDKTTATLKQNNILIPVE